MSEKRQFVRLKEPLVIRYYVIGGEDKLKEAEVVDSGRGGVRLKTEEPLKKGSLLEMELMLPLRSGGEGYAGGYKRAVVMGRVLRSQPAASGEGNEYGLRFVQTDLDMQEQIRRFLESRLAQKEGQDEKGT